MSEKSRVFFLGGGIASNNVTYLQVTSRATLEVSNNSFLERRSVYHMYELVNYHELLWECIHNYYNYYNYYPKYQYIELPWTTSIFALEVCLQFYFDCFSPAFFITEGLRFFFRWQDLDQNGDKLLDFPEYMQMLRSSPRWNGAMVRKKKANNSMLSHNP